LGQLAKDAAAALQKALTDEDKDVRDAAAEALAAIEKKAAKPPIGAASATARARRCGRNACGWRWAENRKIRRRQPSQGSQLKVLEVRTPWGRRSGHD